MSFQDAVDAGCPITLEEFTASWRPAREGGQLEDGFDERAVSALNAATALLRILTGRELKSKLWRIPVVVSGLTIAAPEEGSEASAVTITGESFTGIVVVGDDVNGASALTGQRVVEIKDSQILIAPGWNEPPAGEQTLVFGSEPMYLSGEKSSSIRAIEYPVTEVLSCALWDGTNWNEVDVTGLEPARFQFGRLEFANQCFPLGNRNVRLECRAGYVMPGADGPGHPFEWAQMRKMWLEAAKLMWNEESIAKGFRTAARTGMPGAGDLLDTALPPVLADLVDSFARIA